MTLTDEIINNALSTLDLSDEAPNVLYDNLPNIMKEVDKQNAEKKFEPSTTGAITERYVGWALEASIPESFYKLGGAHQWLGDYVLLAKPMPITLSVKSYTARERAHTSGTGNYIAPTILYGLFKDENEFKLARMGVYQARGFLAIYMPLGTIEKLPADSREVKNLYGRPLIRDFLKIQDDVKGSLEKLKLGKRKIDVINQKKF